MHAKSLHYRLTTALVILSITLNFLPMHSAVRAAGAPPATDGLSAAAAAPDSALPVLAAASLSISRVQSTYIAGTTTITFTLTNNLPLTILPEVPAGANNTDALAILSTFTITDDVNTLHNLSLADSLAAGVTLLSASGCPLQNGSSLTWTLPDLPPLASASITMTVQTPAAGAGRAAASFLSGHRYRLNYSTNFLQ